MKRVFIIVFALLSTSIVRADEGMWLLSLLGKNIEQMQAQGCKLTAEDIYSVNQASLKDAIVGLGNDGRRTSFLAFLFWRDHFGQRIGIDEPPLRIQRDSKALNRGT